MLYPFQCDDCGYEWDEVMSIDETRKRDAGLSCPQCGGHASRVFIMQKPFVKKTRVGDVWDKSNVATDPQEVKKRNQERVNKMRKDKEDRPKKIQLGYGQKSRDTEK